MFESLRTAQTHHGVAQRGHTWECATAPLERSSSKRDIADPMRRVAPSATAPYQGEHCSGVARSGAQARDSLDTSPRSLPVFGDMT